MNEQQLNKMIDEISLLSGGLNDIARKELLRQFKFVYLDGLQDGLKQAEEILKD